MIVKDCTNVNKTNNHAFSPDFGHAKKCGRLIQFMGSKSPSLDVCIDLVHHEALSVTHRWSHFNYSPLTSNQSMINYMYGLLTMIMKITHIVEERLIICFQQKYTCTYICTGKWMIISWKKGCVTCNVQSVELKERVCYMQCSICWTKRKGVLHAMFNLLN